MLGFTFCGRSHRCNIENYHIFFYDKLILGAIQRMFNNVSHKLFSLFETLFLRLFGSENYCLTTWLGFNSYFLTYSFWSWKQSRLKVNDRKSEKCPTGRGGGVIIEQKSVTYYLNGPYYHLYTYISSGLWNNYQSEDEKIRLHNVFENKRLFQVLVYDTKRV